MLMEFNSSSEFVFFAIPSLYPTGYTVVMNCWFYYRNEKEKDQQWLQEKLANSKLPNNHPLREKLESLIVGNCLIYHSDDIHDAEEVYNTFSDPDVFYVTFWENGKITNENT